MSYYLLLRFKDTGLVLNNKSSRPQGGWVHALNEFGINSNVPTREIDYNTPIGVSQISNMLHVLFGLAPKPTYRQSMIPRNNQIYELAKKAKIWYEDACNEKMYEKSEVISCAKYAIDSHKTPHTKIGDEVFPGVYTWAYLFKWIDVRGTESFANDLLSLLNSVLSCDNVVKAYDFEHLVLALREHHNDERMIKFYEDYNVNKIIGSHFSYMLFGKPLSNGKIMSGNNTHYRHPTPLLESRGISQRKTKLSGEILVEFDDEKLVKVLHENGILPTLLDGGIVTIVSLKNYPPDPLDYMKFKEISEQIIPVSAGNE